MVWPRSCRGGRPVPRRLVVAGSAIILVCLLAAGFGACGRNAFVDAYGPPPSPAQGVNVWIVSGGGAIWHSRDGGASWHEQSSGTARRLIGVAFSGVEHGWVVGMDGLILATSNGGATWRTQTSSGPPLWRVVCVDSQHVWAFGPTDSGARLVATTDGGATWRSRVVRGVDLSFGGGIAFADASHGWLVAGSTIRATSDGGTTWLVQLRRSDYRLQAVACSDARHAWAVGSSLGDGEPLVLATSDGGARWVAQHVGKPGVDLGEVELSAVACAGSRHVWATTDSQGMMVATSDGGRSWQVRQYSAPVSGQTIAAADAAHVFLMTAGQPLMVSSNGGLTWRASGRGEWLPEGPAQGIAAVLDTKP